MFFAAVLVIVAYLAYTIFAFNRIPKSISDTYYQWKDRGAKFMFTAVMWTIAALLLPYWVTVSPDNLQFLPFLSMSGLAFVGAACAFKETLTDSVHYTSAGIWAGSALLYFILMQNWVAIFIGGVFGLITCTITLARNSKHFTFWAECACIVMMMVGIYMI